MHWVFPTFGWLLSIAASIASLAALLTGRFAFFFSSTLVSGFSFDDFSSSELSPNGFLRFWGLADLLNHFSAAQLSKYIILTYGRHHFSSSMSAFYRDLPLILFRRLFDVKWTSLPYVILTYFGHLLDVIYMSFTCHYNVNYRSTTSPDFYVTKMYLRKLAYVQFFGL